MDYDIDFFHTATIAVDTYSRLDLQDDSEISARHVVAEALLGEIRNNGVTTALNPRIENAMPSCSLFGSKGRRMHLSNGRLG